MAKPTSEDQYAVTVKRVDGGTTTLYIKASSAREARELAEQDVDVERATSARKL